MSDQNEIVGHKTVSEAGKYSVRRQVQLAADPTAARGWAMNTCEGLMKRLGFDCRLVGEATIGVSTPFSFVDGQPIGFYLSESNLEVRITDNSDTLAHFAAIGYDITDRKKWRGIKQLVEQFGFTMLDTGEIVGSAPVEQQQWLVMKYLSAMLAVVDFEREYIGVPEEIEQFVQEVEMYLRAWKPNFPPQPQPVLQGHSGRLYKFNFEQDGKLIDAVRPHGSRTGSLLRKAADVKHAGEPKEILIVMDDRELTEAANIETDILSTMVSVMPFTRLEQLVGPIKPRRPQ